ncbi:MULTISPECIES: hypothetical protein [unclassified Microcoleus]|uniref:hypothetical protein n=1 Tax=unclassified Microcoleus TaxID=2642155 RepID=UPI0025CF23E6|nr:MULTISPECIES: hypothetical protein [unclassified Microcoleus]
MEYIKAQILPITFENTEIHTTLPLHHRDPFVSVACAWRNRILVAQAVNHSLVLISWDEAFDAYPIQRVW